MGSVREFMDRFRFDPARAFYVGVERECFVVDRASWCIVPRAQQVLANIESEKESSNLHSCVGYELSACQVETRTQPSLVGELRAELCWQDRDLRRSMESIGFSPLYEEVAPASMPLDVYPDPSGRYAEISKKMPPEVLLAACRVIGTHVHVGMPDHETALRVYNRVISDCDDLCLEGDGSYGERLSIYKIVAPDAQPVAFDSWDSFFETAVAKGYVEDPRKCWTLIRISAHGTIEFRMFGATASIIQIEAWARRCYNLCVAAAKC